MDIVEIRSIVIKEAKLSLDALQISDSMDLDDAGMTSLARMNVILALEDHFQITFPDEMMTRDNFASIAAVSKTVAEVLSKPHERVGAYIRPAGIDGVSTLSANV